MTLLTLRPDVTLSGGDTVVGGVTAHAVTADNSDGSYVESVDFPLTVGFPDALVPIGAMIPTVTLRVRNAHVVGSGQSFINVVSKVFAPPGFELLVEHTIMVTTPSTYVAIVGAGGWAQTEINGIEATFSVTAAAPTEPDVPRQSIRTYAVYLDVTYVAQPSLVVTAPVGTIGNTNRPVAIVAPTLDADGGSVQQSRFKVFSAAQYEVIGFNPANSTPMLDSGDRVSGDLLSWQVADALPDGTYRVYAQVAQRVNGVLHPSGWAFSGFVINVVKPSAPTLVVTPQGTSGRVQVSVTETPGSPTSTDRVELQRASTDYLENLIENPGFEVTTAPWVANIGGGGAVPLTRDLSSIGRGNYSGRVTAAAVLHTGYVQLGYVVDSIPTTPGRNYVARCRVRMVSPLLGSSVALGIEFFNSAGGFVGSSGSISLPAVTTVTELITSVGTSPTGAAFVRVSLYVTNSSGVTATVDFEVDNIMLAESSAPLTEYIDGDVPGCVWLGARHVSASVRGSWGPVRGNLSDSGVHDLPSLLVRDYEASNGKPTLWRARSSHSYSGVYAASAWTRSLVAWSDNRWWIKHPNNPTLNTRLRYAAVRSSSRAGRQGVFHPVGSPHPVVISDTPAGYTGELRIRAESLEEANRVSRLFESSGGLLLQGPADSDEPDRYVYIVGESRDRIVDGMTGNKFEVEVSWAEVDRPAGLVLGSDYYAV